MRSTIIIILITTTIVVEVVAVAVQRVRNNLEQSLLTDVQMMTV
jgi:hypothetical protein